MQFVYVFENAFRFIYKYTYKMFLLMYLIISSNGLFDYLFKKYINKNILYVYL